ncbi:MAG: alpha/beta hydrolase-fold protein [Mucilaginibacter sp.]
MKYYLLTIILIALSQTGSGQNKNQINIGTIETVHSGVLNEDRKLLIYTPPGLSNDPKSAVRYPVIYLLDGEVFFHSFTGIAAYLSSTGKMPEMIVVGITNVDRTRDLTPTHSVYWSDGEKDERALRNSGGGEKFISFVQNEVIPYIEATYPTAPYRMFVGHSLGGLTVINALVNHSSLFNSYVAIDPSVWWDNRALMNKAGQVFSHSDYANRMLFYASANTMDKHMDTLRVMNDTANANVHVRDNLQFRSLLQNDKTSRLAWQWKYYPEDNHPSVPLIAGYDALRFLFKGYELPKEMNDPSLTAEEIRVHFNNVSKLMGYQVKPSERTVNLLGYGCLSNKQFSRAFTFFKMNVENYPQSFNVHDSMGDYYLAVADKKNAVTAFTKALTLQENPETRKKLTELKLNH